MFKVGDNHISSKSTQFKILHSTNSTLYFTLFNNHTLHKILCICLKLESDAPVVAMAEGNDRGVAWVGAVTETLVSSIRTDC